MESIPRQKSVVGCLSLKLGSVIIALIVILYSLIAISVCFAELSTRGPRLTMDDWPGLATFGLVIFMTIVHSLSFMLSAVMLLGALKEQSSLLKPWVEFKATQIVVEVIILVWVTVNSFNHMYELTLQLFINILVEFYMLVIVSSHYKELSESAHEFERLRNIDQTWYSDEPYKYSVA